MSGAAARAVISDIYRQVAAPSWAAPNLDGLADVLRDLSWLPEGPVDIAVPDLDGLPHRDRVALLGVLRRAVAESAVSPHPLRADTAPRPP
ncbi:MAG TPA: hypothetical protein VGN35_01240 [Jatrophihabitantaceae bacterium]|nr:hypothetical protein [Jatrophihabitantaceae bacterium]